jgi:hypothetical protein
MARTPHHAPRAIAALADRMLKGMEDYPAAQQMQAQVNRIRQGAEALDRANANRNPLETRAAHMKKIAAMARKLDQETVAVINRTAVIWGEAHAAVQRRIEEKVDLRPDSFAQEIRSAFRALDAEAQAALIKDLIDGNRGPEMAAIVRAPAVLTGISEDRRAMYERAIVSKHAGNELDEQARLAEVFEAVSAVSRTAGNFTKSLTDPVEFARIEREEAAANAAGADFDQSLQ